MKNVPIRDFAFINPESIKKDYSHEIIEYIDISSVSSGYLNQPPKKIPLQEAPSRARRIVKHGDTILAMVRPNLRSFLYMRNPVPNTIVSTGFAVLRAKPEVDSRYLYYAITDKSFTGYLTKNMKGTSYPAVKVDTVLRGEIPYFNYEAQTRIADILSAYDKLIANNRRRITLLERAAQLLYKEWFVDLRFPGYEHTRIVDGVPEGWDKGTAFDAMKILSGGTPKTSNSQYWGGNIPFYTPKDSRGQMYVLETEKSLTEEGLKNCNSSLYPKNTIFITARGTVGKITLAQTEMAMNQSCYALKAIPPFNQIFLYFSLTQGVEQFKKRAVGSVFDAIIRDTFKLIPFVVPSPELIEAFTEKVRPNVKQIDILFKQNEYLRKARDLLLPRLLNGEISV